MDAKKKVLIIDDEPDMLEILRLRLETSGFEVLSASNREEAFAQVKRNPDVILLDILMPYEDDGYHIFRDLKSMKTTKDIPIIFLTRKTEDREKALCVGASYFVIKPYESKDLLEKIDSALRGGKESL